MSGVDVGFGLLAALAVVAGWRVFRTDSMVRASFFLLASFLAVGGVVLLLGAPYLGAAILFMMAVEMMVMAVFMVMFMMNPAGLNPMNMVHQPRVAAGAGAATAAAFGALALAAEFPARPAAGRGDVVAALGHEMLGGSMLVFESAGVAILASMVAAVVLSGHRGRFGPAHEGSRPPALTPRPDDEEGGEEWEGDGASGP